MKFRYAITATAFVVLLLLVVFCWRLVTRVGLSHVQHDFGLVRTGEQLEHTFRKRNIAFRTLRVSGIKSSCGCTVPQLKDHEIAPLGMLEVPVVLNSAGKEGHFRSIIEVDFENQPSIQLVLQGNFLREHPERLDFSEFRRDDPPLLEFQLHSANSDQVAIREMKYDEQFFDVSTTPQPKGQTIKVSVREGLPSGAFEKSLEITTDDETHPVKKISLVGYVIPRLVITPRHPSLGNIETLQPNDVRLTINAPYGDHIEVINVDSPRLQNVVESRENADPTSAHVIVSLPKDAGVKKGFFEEPVSIRVKIGNQEESISTTVYGRVP